MILRLSGQGCADTKREGGSEGMTRVPLVGRIATGALILADELVEVVPLPRMLVGNGDDLNMLKVIGNFVIGAAIADGDWLVVRRQASAENGDINAAMVNSDTGDDGGDR